MRSFFKLLDVDPRVDATNVLTASLPIDQREYPDPAGLNAYLASISAAVEALPGVRQTAMTSVLPLQGWGYGVPYAIAGRELMDRRIVVRRSSRSSARLTSTFWASSSVRDAC